MAQTQRRMIYTKIWASAQFNKLSDKAKLLFIGTITFADDDGKLIGNPSYLRGQIFPFDENISVTETLQLRNEIEKNLLFTTFIVDKIEYIEHPNWSEYQIIRKDLYKPSSLPSRNENVTKPLQKRDISKVKLSKDKIRENAEQVPLSPFSLKEELGKMQKDPKIHIRLLALFFFKRKIDLSSREELQIAIGRHSRDAVSVSKFSKDKILKAMEECVAMEKDGIKWTMGTVLRCLTK